VLPFCLHVTERDRRSKTQSDADADACFQVAVLSAPGILNVTVSVGLLVALLVAGAVQLAAHRC
jgi:hypothetical protein